MKKNWHAQQAVITGGASGIGLAIAKKLQSLGVKVVLCDCDAKKLESASQGFDRSCEVACVDVANLGAVETAFAELLRRSGAIDILVNCAGITGITNVTSHEVPPANVEAVFRINFFGSFNTARVVLPEMLRQNYGRILHIASIAGKEGNAGMMAYSASKAAVIAMTKVQGKRSGRHGGNRKRPGASRHSHAHGRSDAGAASDLHDRQNSHETMRDLGRNRGHGRFHCVPGDKFHDRFHFRPLRWSRNLLTETDLTSCLPIPFSEFFSTGLAVLPRGAFYVPYRGVRKWSWETYWIVGGFFAWIYVRGLCLSDHERCVGVLKANRSARFGGLTFLELWGFGA